MKFEQVHSIANSKIEENTELTHKENEESDENFYHQEACKTDSAKEDCSQSKTLLTTTEYNPKQSKLLFHGLCIDKSDNKNVIEKKFAKVFINDAFVSSSNYTIRRNGSIEVSYESASTCQRIYTESKRILRNQVQLKMNRHVRVEQYIEPEEMTRMRSLKKYGDIWKSKKFICSYDIVRASGDLRLLIRWKNKSTEEKKILSLEELQSDTDNDIPQLC